MSTNFTVFVVFDILLLSFGVFSKEPIKEFPLISKSMYFFKIAYLSNLSKFLYLFL